MEGATHFIQVWKGATDRLHEEKIMHIGLSEREPTFFLDMSIEVTIKCGFSVVAVWKVKPREGINSLTLKN